MRFHKMSPVFALKEGTRINRGRSMQLLKFPNIGFKIPECREALFAFSGFPPSQVVWFAKHDPSTLVGSA
ncbi:hypothetical protein [Roseovarius sp.]|uniref:hypothetical protein n=1 Tax=Roseovarius sp. TaxID=1486281 RepID=UPI002621FA06|nr:hypothetical protein [Roseovarius sp.]